MENSGETTTQTLFQGLHFHWNDFIDFSLYRRSIYFRYDIFQYMYSIRFKTTIAFKSGHSMIDVEEWVEYFHATLKNIIVFLLN